MREFEQGRERKGRDLKVEELNVKNLWVLYIQWEQFSDQSEEEEEVGMAIFYDKVWKGEKCSWGELYIYLIISGWLRHLHMDCFSQ